MTRASLHLNDGLDDPDPLPPVWRWWLGRVGVVAAVVLVWVAAVK